MMIVVDVENSAAQDTAVLEERFGDWRMAGS
jgi:hypothetical protein